jgi:hypothetical protein
MKNPKIFIVVPIMLFIFNACKKKEPKPEDPPANETELITTLKLIFTDTSNNLVRTAMFYDSDGEGQLPPSIFDTIKLSPNRVYRTDILLLDETKNPVDSVSGEVLEEGADHLFVFAKSGVNLNIAITDKDKNNLPIGLNSLWTTGTASSGTVTVTLRHQPGVKDGTYAPGETDVEVVFPCRLQ